MNEYIENPHTHSKFWVIGKTDQLDCGVRFWVDETEIEGSNCTYLGFRIRIQMRENYPQPLSFSHVVAVQFPEMDFTKKTKDYVSWTGGWMIKIPMSKVDKILHTIESNGLIAQMYDLFSKSLMGIDWVMSREEFVDEVFGVLKKDMQGDIVQTVDNSKILKFVSPLISKPSLLDEAQSL